MPALPDDALDTEAELMAQILYERRYELYAQGVRWEDLRRLADSIGADRDALVEIMEELVERIPTALRDVCGEAVDQGLSHPVLDRLQKEVGKHASACQAALRRDGLPRVN